MVQGLTGSQAPLFVIVQQALEQINKISITTELLSTDVMRAKNVVKYATWLAPPLKQHLGRATPCHTASHHYQSDAEEEPDADDETDEHEDETGISKWVRFVKKPRPVCFRVLRVLVEFAKSERLRSNKDNCLNSGPPFRLRCTLEHPFRHTSMGWQRSTFAMLFSEDAISGHRNFPSLRKYLRALSLSKRRGHSAT